MLNEGAVGRRADTAPGIFLGICCLAAIIAVAAGLASAAALLGIVGCIAIVALFVAPRAAMVTFGVFLLLQPALVNLAGSTASPLGLVVRRAHEVFTAAAAVRVVVMAGWRRLPVPMLPWLCIVIVFGAAGTLSAVLGSVPFAVNALGAFLALKFPILFLAGLTIEWRASDANRLVSAMCWLAVALLCIGTIWLLLPEAAMNVFNEPGAELQGFFSRGAIRSMQAPFTHPGTFGWAMALCGCYAVARLMARKEWLGVTALGAGVVGIVASLRRKPLVGLPVGALLWVMVTGSRRQRWGVVVLLVVVASGVYTFGRNRIATAASDAIAGYLDPYAPTTSRTLLYVTGWQLARQRFPLGAGFGRFGGYASQLYYSPVYDQFGLSSVWGLSRDFPNYIEDTYWPHVLGETGVIGLGALLTFYAMIYVGLRRLTTKGLDPGVRAVAMGAGMALVEAMLESGASPIFEAPLQAFLLAMPVAVALVAGRSISTTAGTAGDPLSPSTAG